MPQGDFLMKLIFKGEDPVLRNVKAALVFFFQVSLCNIETSITFLFPLFEQMLYYIKKV